MSKPKKAILLHTGSEGVRSSIRRVQLQIWGYRLSCAQDDAPAAILIDSEDNFHNALALLDVYPGVPVMAIGKIATENAVGLMSRGVDIVLDDAASGQHVLRERLKALTTRRRGPKKKTLIRPHVPGVMLEDGLVD